MSQRLLVINGKKLDYDGIFDFQKVVSTIKNEAAKLGYNWHEKRFEEAVTDEGKEIFIEFRPTKVKTSYYALMVKIIVEMKGVTEVSVDVNGVPQNFQHGSIKVLFDAWVSMMYAARWNMKPGFYFLKAIVHKYIYKFPMEGKVAGEVGTDTRKIHARLKEHLAKYSGIAGQR